MKENNGLHSVEIGIDKDTRDWDIGTWFFSQNGHSRTGVDISVKQFDILKKLITNPRVVEYYENLRTNNTQ